MTTNVLISLLITGFLYWIIRNLYYNSIALQYQYKLYKLRDKVRMYAIDKKIKQHDVFFDYMDSSICVTIKQMPYFNIIGLSFLYASHKNDEKIAVFKKTINTTLESNEYAMELYDEYGKIIAKYMQKRHYILSFIARSISIIFNITRKADYASNVIKSVRVFPETSSAYKVLSN